MLIPTPNVVKEKMNNKRNIRVLLLILGFLLSLGSSAAQATIFQTSISAPKVCLGAECVSVPLEITELLVLKAEIYPVKNTLGLVCVDDFSDCVKIPNEAASFFLVTTAAGGTISPLTNPEHPGPRPQIPEETPGDETGCYLSNDWPSWWCWGTGWISCTRNGQSGYIQYSYSWMGETIGCRKMCTGCLDFFGNPL